MKKHALELTYTFDPAELKEDVPEGVMNMFGCGPETIKRFIDKYIIEQIYTNVLLEKNYVVMYLGEGKIMTLKELIKGKTVKFVCYREGELTYRTEDGFEFPVPTNDTGTGTFLNEDKAILYMRWIRKQYELQEDWLKQKQAGGQQ